MNKNELLEKMAERIKSLGYDVYMYEGDFNKWLIFSDGFNVAYAGVDCFGYCSISSKNKPCKEAGTGINVLYEGFLSDITKEVCEDALSFVPKWYRERYKDLRHIKKWGVQEFFDNELNNWKHSYTKL